MHNLGTSKNPVSHYYQQSIVQLFQLAVTRDEC